MNSVFKTYIKHRYNVHVLSGIRAYEQLGNRAFGPVGKIVAGMRNYNTQRWRYDVFL